MCTAFYGRLEFNVKSPTFCCACFRVCDQDHYGFIRAEDRKTVFWQQNPCTACAKASRLARYCTLPYAVLHIVSVAGQTKLLTDPELFRWHFLASKGHSLLLGSHNQAWWPGGQSWRQCPVLDQGRSWWQRDCRGSCQPALKRRPFLLAGLRLQVCPR